MNWEQVIRMYMNTFIIGSLCDVCDFSQLEKFVLYSVKYIAHFGILMVMCTLNFLFGARLLVVYITLYKKSTPS